MHSCLFRDLARFLPPIVQNVSDPQIEIAYVSADEPGADAGYERLKEPQGAGAAPAVPGAD